MAYQSPIYIMLLNIWLERSKHFSHGLDHTPWWEWVGTCWWPNTQLSSCLPSFNTTTPWPAFDFPSAKHTTPKAHTDDSLQTCVNVYVTSSRHFSHHPTECWPHHCSPVTHSFLSPHLILSTDWSLPWCTLCIIYCFTCSVSALTSLEWM